jgi:serine protease Do
VPQRKSEKLCLLIHIIQRRKSKMKHKDTQTRRLAAFISILVVMTFFLITHNTQAAFPAVGKEAPASFADLADEVAHSVVNISTTQVVKGSPMQPFFEPNAPFRDFFGEDFFKRFFGDIPQGEMRTHALGSGFVIDQNGSILTNNHVIEKATEIKVKLENGKEYDAKVIGRDPKTDLALIQTKVDADLPKPVGLGDSDAIRVGDWVMAVGNPFGLGHTVTTGIISARGRIIGAGPYDDFLQTDAAINPGNSGGPLFNMKGEVIGINTAIVAQGQNIGFAIPVNMAKALLPQLKSGRIIRGWLGVMIQDVTPELAKPFGLEEAKGVVLSDVTKGSPAEKAGLKRGDVLIRFNGKGVENAHTLSRLVAATPPDTKVKVDVIRDGKEKTIRVAIGTMSQAEAGQLSETTMDWGLTVQDITPELARRLGLNPGEKGVVISGVEPGSRAAKAGLRRGDVIKEVQRQGIQNLSDYNRALEKAKQDKTLLFLVKRGRGTLYVVLEPIAKG